MASSSSHGEDMGATLEREDHRRTKLLLNHAQDPSSSVTNYVKSPGRVALLVRMFHEPPSWLPLAILFHNQILFALMHGKSLPLLLCDLIFDYLFVIPRKMTVLYIIHSDRQASSVLYSSFCSSDVACGFSSTFSLPDCMEGKVFYNMTRH